MSVHPSVCFFVFSLQLAIAEALNEIAHINVLWHSIENGSDRFTFRETLHITLDFEKSTKKVATFKVSRQKSMINSFSTFQISIKNLIRQRQYFESPFI